MHSNYRGLAFLLSIGSLPLACSKDDKDPEVDDSTSTPATNTANATTGTDATDPTPTTDPTDATTTTGATDPGMTSVTSSQVTDTGSETGDTESLPPATDPTCIAQAAHAVECDPSYARYQNYIAQQCEYYKAYALMKDGQACADAFDAYYVCLSTIDCADLMSESACSEQSEAIGAACPSLTDGGTDGGTDTGG